MTKTEAKFDWPIIGNRTIVNFLKRNIHSEKISHAYFFVGPKQIGKRLMANIFSKTILCQNSAVHQSTSPCGSCIICQQFEKGIHSDFFVLTKEKDKKNISVESIRSFQHQLNTTSLLGDIKIGIIDNAGDLSEEGANALLKTLEEPPSKSIIILITQTADSLPATVSSRCQILRFQSVARSEISIYLEQLGCSKKMAEKISALAFGRPGRAIDFLRHPPLLQKYEEILDDFFQIFQKDIRFRFSLIQKYLASKNYQARVRKTEEIINIWLSAIRDIILIKEEKLNQIVHLDRIRIVQKTAQSYSSNELLRSIRELISIKESLAKNINPKLALENYFLTIKSYA